MYPSFSFFYLTFTLHVFLRLESTKMMLLTIICYFYFFTVVAFHSAEAKNNPFQLISEVWLIL